MEDELFAGFQRCMIEAGETEIFVRRGGSGPGLLLLHGFPETHVMWHRVAPRLTGDFTVVAADLRGYGASGKPPSTPDHSPYAKSALARDMVGVMDQLGFPRFSVAGHDRGARVAYRMALDHPERIERLALLDIVPTLEAYELTDARRLLVYWPWSLLSQPAPLPEGLVTAAPEAIVDDALSAWGSDRASFPVEVRAAYVSALRDPLSVHAICEEYRAAATLDSARDAADRSAGRRIDSPLLVLWSAGGPLDTWYAERGGPLGIWQAWATNVRGHALEGGHFFPEQNPLETAETLRAFLLGQVP